MGWGVALERIEELDLIQFDSMMSSIGRQRAMQRVCHVGDTAAAGAVDKDRQKYVKDVLKGAGVRQQGSDTKKFLQDFGGGI